MIPVNSISLTGNEKEYLNECLRTGWISSEGPFVTRFEQEMAAFTNRVHGIAVANGSAALDIAVAAIGIAPGDEVIMPAFTIISPALSVVRAGGIPVLVDSDPLTFNMDMNLLEAKITPKTKAIIAVHIYGLPVNMKSLLAIAKKHQLKVIEDAAEMHGQTYDGKPCGSFGDISIFSFYANKHVTTGEGGMILTNDKKLAESSRKLRNLSFDPEKPRFVHSEMGWNYRMTNIQAALGVAQLEKLPVSIEKKRKMGAFYQEELEFIKKYGYQLPLKGEGQETNCYWVFPIVAPSEEEKNRIIAHLTKQQIGTRPFFWSMHEQPVFQKMGLFEGEHYPVSEKLARCGFYIPSGLGLSGEDMVTVVDVIKSYFS